MDYAGYRRDKIVTPVRNYNVFPLEPNLNAQTTKLRKYGEKDIHLITEESEP